MAGSATGKSIVILLDGGKTVCAEGNTYDALRKSAFYFAQSMLLYNPATDRLGIFMLGSSKTKNDLNKSAEGSYEHIEQILPLTKTSFEAVKMLHDLPPGQGVSDYIDALYVAGDHVVSRTGKARLEKHIVLFTDGKAEGTADFESELHSIANVLRTENTKLTVIIPGYMDSSIGEGEFGIQEDVGKVGGTTIEENNTPGEEEDEGGNEKQLRAFDPKSLRTEMKERKAANSQVEDPSKRKSSLLMRNETLLRRVALASDGSVYSLESALLNLLKPKPKSKKAVPKYAGTLCITDRIQIPVKIFSYAMKASVPSAKKLSWERTREAGKMVSALSNVSYLTGKSQKALDEEDELMEEDLAPGYVYGPQLVKVDEATKVNMSIVYEKSLSVIGFVPEEAMHREYFMGSVDVVVAMSNVHQASCAMHALVSAMYSERCGMIARYVPRTSAKFVYLWPEIDGDGKYLYMTEIPTAEDLRSYVFASFDSYLENESTEAAAAIDAHINSMNLEWAEASESQFEGEDGIDEELEEEGPRFDPTSLCNPSIHMLNASAVKRAMDGIDGRELPPREEWIENLLVPFNFLEDRDVAARALRDLKNHFHIQRVERRSRKNSSNEWVAASTDEIDLSAFMPPTEAEGEGKEEESQDDGESVGEYIEEEGANEDVDAVTSFPNKLDIVAEDAMSDVTVFDIREESPVSDFKSMANSGLFVAAIELMETMILRLIRRGNLFQAIECLATVRSTAVEKQNGREFNGFLCRLFRRASQRRGDSVHVISLFREIEAEQREKETLAVVTEKEDSITCHRIGEQAIKDCSERINRIIRSTGCGISGTAPRND